MLLEKLEHEKSLVIDNLLSSQSRSLFLWNLGAQKGISLLHQKEMVHIVQKFNERDLRYLPPFSGNVEVKVDLKSKTAENCSGELVEENY